MSEATVGVKTNPVNSSHVWGILGIFLRNPGDYFFMNYENWNLPFITLIQILFKEDCNSILYIIEEERCVEQQVAIRVQPSTHNNISYLKMHSVSYCCCFLRWSKHTSNLVNCMGWLCHVISIWWRPSALENFYLFFCQKYWSFLYL